MFFVCPLAREFAIHNRPGKSDQTQIFEIMDAREE